MKKGLFLFVPIFALAFVLFIYSLWVAYPAFQDTRLLDSLALIHSLPITYYISVILVLALSLSASHYSSNNKYIHILLLVMFANMLWATPYYFTGFVRLPDGPWKIVQATRIEEILKGAEVSAFWYGKNYPGSFVFSDVFLIASGLDQLVYIRLVFPLFQLVVMILSMYVFLARLFDRRIAFMGVLLTIPGLHYVVLQPAPSSFGLVLMLSLLVLLTGERLERQVVFGLGFFVLVISHSVYSLLLLVLMAGAFVVQRVVGKFKVHVDPRLLLVSSIWFLTWETAYVSQDRSVVFRLSFLLSTGFWQRIFGGSQIYSAGGTIFSNITLIGRATYLIYFGVTLLVIGVTYAARRKLKGYQASSSKERTFLRLNSLETWLFAEVLVFGIMGVAVLLRTPDEAERVLFVFILCCSSIVAQGLLSLGKGNSARLSTAGRYARRGIALMLIAGMMLLVLVYPFVAYSIDSYSNFPFSENVGLGFLSNTTSPDVTILILTYGEQYFFYKTDFRLVPSDSIAAARDLDSLNTVMTRDLSAADVVVLRSTAYFLFSVRIDRSFENNKYLQVKQRLESTGFDLVYSNPSYDMWVKTR